jgi:hypothetical protein
MSITSLAALKRATPIGATLTVVASTAPHIKVGEVRTIEVKQANAIAWRGVWANGGRDWQPETQGWLYWPKAADFTFHGDDTFSIDFGRWTSTYRAG